MKIIHSADWHLGKTLCGYSLFEDQEYFVGEFVKICAEQNVDAILISGDIFDTSVSSSDAVKLYSKFITSVARLNKTIVLISGNHDGSARLSQFSELLKENNIHLVGTFDNLFFPIRVTAAGETVDVFAIPYFNSESVKQFTDKPILSYNEAMEVIVSKMKDNFGGNKKILLAHCFVTGSVVADSDSSAKVGNLQAVSKDVFKDFDYTALGHLHSPQKVTDKIRYAGSPLKYSFSEAEHKKGVYILDTRTGVVEQIPIKPLHGVAVVKGDYESVLRQAKSESGRNDFIKIILTDRTNYGLFDVFKEYYPHLCGISAEILQTPSNYVTPEEISKLSGTELLEGFFSEVLKTPLTEKHRKIFAECAASDQNSKRQ